MEEHKTPEVIDERTDLVIHLGKYLFENPIILAGVSVSGLIMALCISYNNFKKEEI